MAKLTKSLLGLSVSGSISGALTYLRRMRHQIVEKKPELKDRKTTAQLSWRHMFNKAVALWNALSDAEQAEWESAARPKHMTGFAWFISQALRPNPGIYLPLQGGTMQGIIDMAGYKIEDLLDPVAVQDADTKAARDAAIAAAIGGSLTCDIYGWDGSIWQKVPVQSIHHHALQTAITFDGQVSVLFTGASDGLATGWWGLATTSRLLGFNGTTWDRLRSHPGGILKVGRTAIDSTTLRKTVTGAVIDGIRQLFWISCSPDSPGAEFELTDAIAGGAAVVFDHFDPDKHSEVINFDPPMKFANGIWIEKFDHIHSLVFCYI